MTDTINAGAVAPVAPAAGVPSVESQSTESERLVPQSTVDKVVAGVKRDSYERGKQEALESLKANTTSPASLPADAIKDVVKSVLSEEKESSKKAQLEADERERQKQYKIEEDRILAELAPKVKDVHAAHPDFVEQMNESGIADRKDVAYFANFADNAGFVLYELSKSPAKLATLTTLIAQNPKSAKKYVLELAERIKANSDATHQKVAPKPLSQLKPSVAADNGKLGLQDLKRKYRI